MSESESHKTATDKAREGVGVGIGLVAAGLLALGVPLVWDVGPNWLTTVFCVALTLGGLGVAGALFELAKLRGRPSLNDLGAVVMLGAIGMALLLTSFRHDPPTLITVPINVLAGLCLLIAVIGLGIGLGKAHGEGRTATPANEAPQRAAATGERRPQRLSTSDKVMISATSGSAILTAAATIVAAVIQGSD